MIREEYIELREHNKNLAKKLRISKHLSRKFESRLAKCLNKSNLPEFMKDKDSSYQEIQKEMQIEREKGNLDYPYLEFRSNHIFLSMCRGKTLDQIEPNRVNDTSTVYMVNARVIKLCEKYELEFEVDNMTIVSVKRHWIEEKVA